jgi:hypothetical protein
MPESVTIKRRALTSDGFGGATTGTPSTVASAVPARITQAQVQVMGGQAGRALLLEKWTVRMPVGTDLQDEDFIIWGTITLQVEDVKARTWDTCVSAMAEVVK